MKIVKRVIVSLLLAIGAAILLLGPRPQPSLPPERQHDLLIHYWEKWVGNEQSQMQQIVDDFNNTVGRDKHIYVEYLSMSNIDQKTLVATAGGVPPDVAGLWDGSLIQYASLGALEPLDDLAAANGIGPDYYKPVYWNGCHWNGHLYALISTPAAVALIYNTRIFRENAAKLRAAGLDPNRPPATLQQLDRYASVLNTFIIGPDGKRHLDRAGYLPKEPGWYINQTAYWFGGQLWDEKNQRFTLTDPAVIDAYKWIQSYSLQLGQDVISEYSSGVTGLNSPQNAFLSDKLAMELQGPWMANFIHQLKPSMDHDWAAAPFPSAVPGLNMVSYCPFDTLCIPKGCKHKQEAFEFIAFVNRQDEMEKLCSLHCKNSPLAHVSRAFLQHHPNPYISVFEALSRSPNARGPMRCPIAPEADAEITAMTDRIIRLEIDPETALRQTQDILQNKYQDYLDQQRARDAN